MRSGRDSIRHYDRVLSSSQLGADAGSLLPENEATIVKPKQLYYYDYFTNCGVNGTVTN